MISFELYHKVLDLLRLRSRHYRTVFNPALGSTKAVLADLARFSRFNETPYHKDPNMVYVLIGRQEVFQRIVQHTKLQPDQLYALFDGREVAPSTAPTTGDAE